MSDLLSFLNAIEAEPTNDFLWLVFADWLEEQGNLISDEVRTAVKSGDWARLRQELLRPLKYRQARQIALECLSRILPIYEALCPPRDLTPRNYIEIMLHSKDGAQVQTAVAAFHESFRLRLRSDNYLSNWDHSELEIDFMSNIRNFITDFMKNIRSYCAHVNELCSNCARMVTRIKVGTEWQVADDWPRWRFSEDAETRWQVARVFRHRF